MDAVTLARHDEHALAEAAQAIAPHSEQIGAMVVSYSEPDSWLNQSWNVGLDEPVTVDQVDRIVAFFDTHQCDVRIGLTTPADPSARRVLAGRGLDIVDFIHVFQATLTSDDGVASALLDPEPPDLEIVRIDREDGPMLDRWAELSARGFSDGERPPSASVRTFEKLVRHDGVDGYVATVDGTPAAAAAVAIADAGGIRGASFFATSVLPEFRRRGIQQQLMAARLHRARAQDASVALVGSLPGVATERNARRLGFELSHMKVNLVRSRSADQQ